MWLTNSSVGRKVVMSITGLFLILFVTFHVLMNAVAIFWPKAYCDICEFLGANWYTIIGTLILAAGCVIHIIYALWLTWQNRKARGADKYEVSKRPKSVEWASQNMLVLGLIVVCFLIVHLTQFWAKMQLAEILGEHVDPGIAYVYAAFSKWWTLPVYIIGFAALWFHITHGFWSAFQTLGANNTTWLPRLKNTACVWATVVALLFAVEAIAFTVQANCPKRQAGQCQLVKGQPGQKPDCCQPGQKPDCFGQCPEGAPQGCPQGQEGVRPEGAPEGCPQGMPQGGPRPDGAPQGFQQGGPGPQGGQPGQPGQQGGPGPQDGQLPPPPQGAPGEAPAPEATPQN